MNAKRYRNRMGNEAIILRKLNESTDGKITSLLECRILKGVTVPDGLEFKINESQFKQDWRET